MSTYVVETTVNPGVEYEVDAAEYQQLLELGLLVNGPVDPVSPGVFDSEVAALVEDVASQTRAALDALPGGGGGAVDSVNGQTGAVVLDAADVGADATGSAAAAQAFAVQRANHTGTQASATLSDLTETVQDIVAALVVAGSGVTASYDDAAGTFTISATGGGGSTDPEIVRDVIGTALVAGSGVQITVDDAGDTITIASTAVLPTRQVSAGTGLTGGGDLSADRTLAVAYGSAAGTAVQGNDARVTADQAAGTASIRTLGTGAQQAAAGNHTHTAAAVGAVAALTGVTDATKVTQAAYDALGAGRPAGRVYYIVG